MDLKKKSNLNVMKSENKSLIPKYRQLRATTKRLQFRMSFGRKSLSEESDHIGSVPSGEKMQSKDKEDFECIKVYSFYKEFKIENKSDQRNRRFPSMDEHFDKLKDCHLGHLHRKIIGQMHLCSYMYKGKRLLYPSDSCMNIQHSQRKIYRGGGYCSGIAVCDKYGNPLENYDNSGSHIETIKMANEKRKEPLQMTGHTGGTSRNKECDGKVEFRNEFTLPKIVANERSIVRIQNTIPNEGVECRKKVSKIKENRSTLKKKAKTLRTKRGNNMETECNQKLPADSKVPIPHEFLFIKTINNFTK